MNQIDPLKEAPVPTSEYQTFAEYVREACEDAAAKLGIPFRVVEESRQCSYSNSTGRAG